MNRLTKFNRYKRVGNTGSFTLGTADGRSYLHIMPLGEKWVVCLTVEYKDMFSVSLPAGITFKQMADKVNAVWAMMLANDITFA